MCHIFRSDIKATGAWAAVSCGEINHFMARNASGNGLFSSFFVAVSLGTAVSHRRKGNFHAG
jgi:hypothetical protein